MTDRLGKTLASLSLAAEKALTRSDQATLLMRSVPAMYVAAEWSEEAELEQARSFWGTSTGNANDYLKSAPVHKATRFVSHSWAAPVNWQEIMGSGCSYVNLDRLGR